MRDYTFIATEVMNHWLVQNLLARDIYEAIASIMMDVMVISFLVHWFFKLHTFRLFLTYIVFYGIRSIIQNRFLMGRPEGYLWGENGFPSMLIVYHDISDFFYSGHVGSCVIALSEYHAQGYRKMCFVIGFIVWIEWTLLMLVRTHYVIDLVCGLIFARIVHRASEKVCWLYDVKICGYPI